MTHPLVEWWQNESRWADNKWELPENALSEGRMAIDAWNAAIQHAMACVVSDGNPMVALEKIAELKYEAK